MKIDYSRLFDIARDFYADLSYVSDSGKALIPLRYFFELTYRCNLQCPYCYVGNERTKNELTKEDWFKVIDQIPFYSFVTLVGGEPLLRKDFIEILHYTAKKTLGKLNVVSNGILISDEIIDAFIESKMMLLSVSLDGYGKNHDINRAKDGIFDKIIGNLSNLQAKKKSKYPMIDIKTIVLQNNLDDIVKLYKLCNEMNFDFLSISFLRNNNLKQNSTLLDSFEEVFYKPEYPIEPYFDMEHFKSVYSELVSLSKNSKTQIRWSPKFDDNNKAKELERIEKFFSTSPNTPINEIYQACKYPYSNMMINPQGDVYPCLSFKIGNVKDEKVLEVFNKPHFKCFRKNLKASKVFNACQMCCELRPKG